MNKSINFMDKNTQICFVINDDENDEYNVFLRLVAINNNEQIDLYLRDKMVDEKYFEVIIPGVSGFFKINHLKLKALEQISPYATKAGNVITNYKLNFDEFKVFLSLIKSFDIDLYYDEAKYDHQQPKVNLDFILFKEIQNQHYRLAKDFKINLIKKLFVNSEKNLLLVSAKTTYSKITSNFYKFIFFNDKKIIESVEIFFKKLANKKFNAAEMKNLMKDYMRIFKFNAKLTSKTNDLDSIDFQSILDASSYKKQVDVVYDSSIKQILVKLKIMYANGKSVILDKRHFLNTNKEDIPLYRNIEAEKEFYKLISRTFNHFDELKQVGVIIENENYHQLKIVLKRLGKNSDYKIKIDNYLESPKVFKTRFISTNIKLKNEFLEIDYVLDGYNKETSQKIIEAYYKKQELVKMGQNKVIDLKQMDFTDLEKNLVILNTSIKDLVDLNTIKTRVHNIYFLDKFLKTKEIREKIKELIKSYKNEKDALISPEIANILRDYQKVGLDWFKKLIHFKFGGILADEMGLGKTLQTIALFDYIYKNNKTNKPSLIICPSSLVYNWKNEFKKFAPYLEIVIVDGSKNDREIILNSKTTGQKIFITSYHLHSRDSEKYLNFEFFATVLDEGQVIKNYLTNFSKDVKRIKSENRFVLTGTPVENDLWELWSIFEFILPGYLLKRSDFRRNLYEPFMNGDRDLLLKKINPFILRRLKKNVLTDLPDKSEKIIEISLEEKERNVYMAQKRKFALHFLKYDPNALHSTINHRDHFAILTALTDLRLLASSIYLKDQSFETSSKLKYTIKLVHSIVAAKQKTLLFTQFTKNIPYFEREMKKNNIKYSILTGETKKEKRLEIVEEFNNDKSINVFIISLKAGGLGLNLTSANNVIHYDPWWNKSIEEQANDRAHRYGQEKGVDVFKLIMKDTIEEAIIEIQNRKKTLVDSILKNSQNSKQALSIKEMLKIINE